MNSESVKAPEPLLNLEGIYYSADNRKVLQDVSVAVRSGELIVIAGKNGAGKSTLLRVAAGLVEPDKGTIQAPGLNGTSSNSSNTILPKVGFVRQQPENQLIAGTVEEEIVFSLALAGLDAADTERRVRRALEQTGMSDYRQRPPHTLSGGEMQRLAIAAALAIEPELWLFDEPTAYLDPASRASIIRTARDLATRDAVLFVASEPEEWKIGDRLVLLHEGRIVADGSPAEVMVSKAFEQTKLPLPRSVRLQQMLEQDSSGIMSASKSGNLPESMGKAPSAVPSQPAKEPLVEIRSLTAARRELFGPERQVLRNIDLKIHAGERIALVGPGGVGKSTLLEVLAGLISAEKGEVQVHVDTNHDSHTPQSLDTLNYRTKRKGQNDPVHPAVSIAFQFPERSFFAETVREELSYGPRNRGASAKDAEKRAAEALESVGLDPAEYLDRHPFLLSGGEARRIAIAATLALQPRVLLLDEPTAGLDAGSADRIGELITELSDAGGAVVVSGHDLDRLADWCPRWILLEEGRITHDGDPRDLWPDQGPDRWPPPQTVRFWREKGRSVHEMPGIALKELSVS